MTALAVTLIAALAVTLFTREWLRFINDDFAAMDDDRED